MYISGDTNTHIVSANSLIISTWQRDTKIADKHLHCLLLLSHGKMKLYLLMLPQDCEVSLQ